MLRGFDHLSRDLPSERDCGRIRRYVVGEASLEDEAWVMQWIGIDKGRREILTRARATYGSAGRSREGEWATPEAWARLVMQVGPGPGGDVNTHPLRPGRPGSPSDARQRDPRLLRAAAVVLFALAAPVLWWRSGPTVGSAPGEMQEVTTEAGQQAHLRLVDGTRVVIAPESRLRYPGRFGSDVREVILEGEAFFDVASESGRPFLVHAGGSLTRVLGTEFNLRSRPGEPYVEMVVSEGRVAFGPADSRSTIELGPGEMGRVASDGTVTEAKADLARALGWLDGRLYFDNARLAEVVEALERRHGVQITLVDPALAGTRITAELRGNDVSEAVRLICMSLGLQAVRTPEGFLIRPARSSTPMATQSSD